MHINKDHGTRAAVWAGAVLAATMGVCAPAGGEPVMHLDGAQPPPVASPASSGLDLGASEDAQWRRELADTLLEVVLPAYESLAATGILQAVRSLETELGLNSGPSFDDRPSGVHAYNAGDGAQPRSVGWSAQGDSVDAWIHARSDAQIAEDRRLANLRVRELIEDAKQWALILVALYGLGYLVKLTLDYRQRKAARQRKRSVMRSRRRRHRHHKRRPPV